jgi:CspA family cold shock protein
MSSSSEVTPSLETKTSSHLTGRVKWFNNKAGYGFITITDGDNAGTDVFVHHSSINVSSQQYKYLVQGEYIEFKLINVENSTHECQAADVRGIKGGKLMCETRHEFKIARNNYRTTVKQNDSTNLPETPSTEGLEGESWNTIQKKPAKPSTTTGQRRGRPPRVKV